MRRLVVWITIGIAVGAASLTQAMAQGPPPALTGELLDVTDDARTGAFTTVANCTAAGGTFSYIAIGNAPFIEATGPYPGTFTETGTVTVGPEDLLGARTVQQFRAQFTIDSPVGHITGTKKLLKSQSAPAGQFNCRFLGSSDISGTLNATYRAVITTATDHCVTRGTASIDIIVVGTNNSFDESFLTGTIPVCGGAGDDEDG